MPNKNAFRPVVHEKMFKQHLNKLESPGPMDAPCQILSDLVWQFLRRRFFKVFPYVLINYYVKVLNSWV